MLIKDVAEKYGLSEDTLRYHERARIIPKAPRKPSGVRDYQSKDLEWIEHALCMRGAGLSIKALSEYLRLFQEGDASIPARLALLKEQMQALDQQKARIEKTMDRLAYKISRYEEAMKTGRLTWPEQEKSSS